MAPGRQAQGGSGTHSHAFHLRSAGASGRFSGRFPVFVLFRYSGVSLIRARSFPCIFHLSLTPHLSSLFPFLSTPRCL
jgi:hypothetical protein